MIARLVLLLLWTTLVIYEMLNTWNQIVLAAWVILWLIVALIILLTKVGYEQGHTGD